MDLIDLLWNTSQDGLINELRDQINDVQLDGDLRAYDLKDAKAEDVEFKLRLGLLVRMLIEKGIITADEYASLIAETRSKFAGKQRS